MTSSSASRFARFSGWLTTIFAAAWVVVFLGLFFQERLPNSSTASDPVTRLDVWTVILSDLSFLNPFSYPADAQADPGWHNVSQRLPHLLTGLLMLLVAWSSGRTFTSGLKIASELTTTERLVIDFGTGLSLFLLWVLICGLAGFLTRFAVFLPGLLIPVAIFLTIRSRRTTPARPPSSFSSATPSRVSSVWMVVILAPFVVHLLLGSMTPSSEFDVREYHLQGPKEWFQAGQITTLEHNVYTSFPFLSEMLSLAAMVAHDDWWTGSLTGKLVLAGFQLLTTMTVYAVARRGFGRESGMIAAIACVSTPWIVRISLIAYAEGATTFYLIASVMAALIATQTPHVVTRRHLIFLTGLLSGSAMAAKYPGLITAVVPAALLVAIPLLKKNFRRSNSTEHPPEQTSAVEVTVDAAESLEEDHNTPHLNTFRSTVLLPLILFTLGTAIAVGPWLLKNAIATGNPVYPLAYGVFGSSDWSAEMDAKWKRAHGPAEHQLSNVPQHVMDVALRNDWQNGFLIALAVPSLLLLRRFTSLRWIWFHAVWVLATWWALTHRIDRFWVPVIPLLCVAAGSSWQISHARTWRTVVIATLLTCCVYNYGFSRLRYIGFHGGLADLDYLQAAPIRQDIAFLNRTLSADARILMVGEAEVFDAHFPLIYNTVFDENIFEQWTTAPDQTSVAREDRSMLPPDEIRARLKSAGITHIFVNWSEILRYRLTYGYTRYIHPRRFADLIQSDVLAAPIPLAIGDPTRLSPAERQEIESWPGSDAVLNETTWHLTQLYRVR